MADSHRTVRPEGTPWAWLPLGLLLAISVSGNLTELFSFAFEPGYFLPVLTAWLASRYGQRVGGLLLLFGVLTLFAASIDVLDYTWVRVGFPADVYLLAVFAAFAFVDPASSPFGVDCLRPWWRWTLWIALLVLTFYLYSGAEFSTDLADGWRVSSNLGLVLAIAIVAAAVRWRRAAERAGDTLGALSGGLPRILAAVVAVLSAIALLANVQYGDGRVRVDFGLSSAEPWLLVLCFVLPAFRILDWRLLVSLLVAMSVGEILWLQYLESARQAAPVAPAGAGGLEQIIVTGTRIDSLINAWRSFSWVSMALLGAAIAPFWRVQALPPLRHGRTPLLLASILVVQFCVAPALSDGYTGFDGLALGGAAFTTGLLWGRPALIVAPLLIQTGALVSLATFAATDRPIVAGMTELVALGGLSFAAAFFGLLANRCERLPGAAAAGSTREPARGAGG